MHYVLIHLAHFSVITKVQYKCAKNYRDREFAAMS